MILVDSSVWIASLRRLDNPVVRKLRVLTATADDEVLIGDLVLLEVLQGARDDAHAGRIERNLRQYVPARLIDPELAVCAARNYRLLRGLGITVRKTVDIVIGTFCIEGGHQLLHLDRDFRPMVQHLGLRLA